MLPEPSAWDALGAAIDELRAELRGAAPDEPAAEEGEAYLMRVTTAALTDGFLGHLQAEAGLSRALPVKGGPNPDYLMYHAVMDPARRYRLAGRLNASERVGVGLYAVGGGVSLPEAYAVFNAASVDENGVFALDLAAGATGPATLPITPASRVLLIRILHRRPQTTPCSLTLTGGAAPRGLTPAGGNAERALTMAAQATLRGVRQFLQWSRLTCANPNRFTAAPPPIAAEVQGDPDTTYRLGYYDLAEGEWLEATIPAGIPGYWSLHAYNHWCEYLPGASAHDLGASADADGRIRVRIGPALAANLANRVDTLGRRRGVLIFRTIGAAAAAVPEAQLRRSMLR